MRLILFDIDGTLLSCGRQTVGPFLGALGSILGQRVEIPDGYSFAGKTDPWIARDLVLANGLPPKELDEALPAVRDEYVARLAERLDPAGMTRLVPDGFLEALAERGVTLGLLTGNWSVGAQIKLERGGIHFEFVAGAFGDDAYDRRVLPERARAAVAGRVGRRFTAAETLLVGDTVLDVDCARAHGIPCYAVASGTTSIEELRAAGADRVAQSLGALTVADLLAELPAGAEAC